MLNSKQRSCEYHFLKSFGMIRLGKMNPRSTDYKADALTTTPSQRFIDVVNLKTFTMVVNIDFETSFFTNSTKLFISAVGEGRSLLTKHRLFLQKHVSLETNFIGCKATVRCGHSCSLQTTLSEDTTFYTKYIEKFGC